MLAYLIWNPMAGQRDARRSLDEALEVFAGAGWDVRLYETVHPGDGTRLARQAVAAGAQVAIAAGGDGTVNELVNGLVGSDVALGVLPVGTGNVWAKELGYTGWTPHHLHPVRDTAQGLLDSSVHTIDLGRANGRYFLLWAGIGFDAEVTHEVEPLVDVKRHLGHGLYWISGISLALSFVGTRSTLVVDGQVYRRRVVMVVISNARLYGGGMLQVAPEACLDDGALDVCIFRGNGTAATLHHFLNLMTQGHMRDPQMNYHRARKIEIYTDKPMAIQIDGDACGTTPLSVEVVPRALKVLVPPTAPAALFQNSAVAVRVP